MPCVPPPSQTESRPCAGLPLVLNLKLLGALGCWTFFILFNFGPKYCRPPRQPGSPTRGLLSILENSAGAAPLGKAWREVPSLPTHPLAWCTKEAEGEVVEMFIGAGHSEATQSVPVYFGRCRPNFRRTSSGTNLPATKW